jgi:hypothetical protein
LQLLDSLNQITGNTKASASSGTVNQTFYITGSSPASTGQAVSSATSSANNLVNGGQSGAGTPTVNKNANGITAFALGFSTQ